MSRKTHIATLPVADLVEDMDFYPRHTVDAYHVQALVQALESGASLPPVVADKKSKRIIDGWHRCRAYRRLHGPSATVDVELIDYPSNAAMLLDAAARNSQHGRRLDAIDKTRCIVMLQRVGCNDSQIAAALKTTEARVQKLAVKIAYTPTATDSVPGTKSITLKRSVAHLAGNHLTASQSRAHAMMPGTSFLLIAKQLLVGLREGLVNLEDARLVEQLRKLGEMISEKIAA